MESFSSWKFWIAALIKSECHRCLFKIDLLFWWSSESIKFLKCRCRCYKKQFVVSKVFPIQLKLQNPASAYIKPISCVKAICYVEVVPNQSMFQNPAAAYINNDLLCWWFPESNMYVYRFAMSMGVLNQLYILLISGRLYCVCGYCGWDICLLMWWW